MQTSVTTGKENLILNAPLSGADASSSGVSWAAILAGAAAAAALSLLLLILGFGLGLSAVSPWAERGADSSSIALSSIVWIAFTQIAAAGVGGYLAGRLRVKWADTHGDEIYFRDTAHGLLSWAIASLAAATLLGSAATIALSGGLQAGATVAAGVGAGAGGAAMHSAAGAANAATVNNASNNNASNSANPLEYFTDALFRAAPAGAAQAVAPTAAQAAPDRHAAEALAIFAYDLRAGALSAEDKEYLGRLISSQTGLSQADAEKRATDVFYQLTTSIAKAEMSAKETADKARKSAAHTSLWMFVALLAGAFCASLSATLGGRQRDEI